LLAKINLKVVSGWCSFSTILANTPEEGIEKSKVYGAAYVNVRNGYRSDGK